MRSAFAGLALAALAVANPAPQAVTSSIAPAASPPAGCQTSHSGSFEIQVVNVTTSSKRDLLKRDALVITLADGQLTDAKGRTGYIAANNQFQFDSPPQAGAKYTSGWSACSNGSLAIGGSTIFYQCLSGNFYNLYDKSTGNQCSPVYIDIISAGSGAGVATAISDGQVTASAAAPVTQISDGQIQASTSAAAVSQISDGQIQAPTSTGKVVTQITDGQIQAPTSTGKVVSQISDGQIQAPTSTGKVVTQISDGQIQAPTSTGKVVTQITDGQIQAPVATGTGKMNTTRPSSSVPYKGSSSVLSVSFSFGAGLLALALLL